MVLNSKFCYHLLMLLIVTVFFLNPHAVAKIFFVFPNGAGIECTSTNPCSFQQALTTAQENGEDDTIYVLPGTYTINSPLTYKSLTGDNGHKLSIIAINTNNSPILTSDGTTQIMQIITSDDEGGDILIKGLTFQNGKAIFGGGLLVNTEKANITLENTLFKNNRAESSGGGAHISTNSGNILISNSKFQDNAVESEGEGGSGGGISLISINGNITIERSSFIGNKVWFPGYSSFGGGAYISVGDPFRQTSNNGQIKVESSNFISNTIYGKEPSGGGGIYLYNYKGNIILTNSFFSFNESNIYGGGIWIDPDGSTAYIINNSFYKNTANYKGGAIHIQLDGIWGSDNLNLYNNIFWSNEASEGGDVYIDVENSNFQNIYNNDFSCNDFSGDSGCLVLTDTNRGYSHADNISADPLFVNSDAGNLHITENSPCIDTGDNNAPELPEKDTDGDDRIIDGNNDGNSVVDIGADEFKPQPPQSTNHPPIIDSIIADPQQGNAPLTVTYTITAYDPDGDSIIYTINFGDGKSYSGQEETTTHTYQKSGEYDAKICVCDIHLSCTCTYKHIEVDPNPSPQVTNFTASPIQGVAPLTVTFTVTAVDRAITNYTYNFGDGHIEQTTEPVVIHTYSDPGIYRATVTVTDDYGNHTQSDPIQIRVGDQRQEQTENGTLIFKTDHSKIDHITFEEPQCDIPEGQQALYGQIAYTIQLPEGTNVETVTLTLPEDAQGMTVYKCIDGQLQDITGLVQISGNTISLTITDNGPFDSNYNLGIIEDPIIIAKPVTSAETENNQELENSSSIPENTTSGSGGCNISSISPISSIPSILILLFSLTPLLLVNRKSNIT